MRSLCIFLGVVVKQHSKHWKAFFSAVAFAGKLHAGDPISSDPTENPNCETPALPFCTEQN